MVVTWDIARVAEKPVDEGESVERAGGKSARTATTDVAVKMSRPRSWHHDQRDVDTARSYLR
jgi:hypothetical protein